MNRGLASFVAGFGTSYLAGLEQKRQRERQEAQDQIAQERAGRERQEYADKQALEAKLAKAAEPTYADQSRLDAAGLRGTMPGVFQDTGTAQNFIDNPNASPDQKTSVLRNYAQMPESGANMGGQQFVAGNDGGVSVADPASAKQKPIWQVMQDRSRIYLESGKPEYAQHATQMLAFSQKLKSQDYLDRITQARAKGLDGLLGLINDHNNDELPMTSARVEQTPDGKMVGRWVNAATGKEEEHVFDQRLGSVEDQITQDLMSRASPEALGNHLLEKIKAARELRREDIDTEKLAASERIAGMREDRRDERQRLQFEAMEQHQARQIEAMQHRAEATAGKVTLAQQANNEEIRLARKRLSGMTMDEVRGKTQQYLPNGRDNLNYDPTLASTWRVANQRMVGDDAAFDQFTERTQPLKKPPTPRQRFESDQSMRGMTMGKMTARGWEVHDASGRLIGHWK